MLQHPRNAADFRLHAGGRDNRFAAAIGRRSAAEDHIVAVAEHRVGGQGSGVFRDGQALARESGFRRVQRGRLEHPRVRRDRVAFLDHDDVAGHEIGSGDVLAFAVANHFGVRGRHLLQRRHGLLRARLLHVTHDGVQEDDGEDRDGFVRPGCVALDEPQRCRYGRGDEQQNDEHVLKLREKLPPSRHGLLGRQHVGTEAVEPCASFSAAQAVPGVRGKCDQGILTRDAV